MFWRSRTLLCTVALVEVAFVAWLVHDWLTQPTTERRVRQIVEAAGLDLPVVDAGEDLAIGWAPMMLVVRAPDGALQLHEVVRDPGQRGGAPDIISAFRVRRMIESVEDEPGDPPKPPSTTGTDEWPVDLRTDPRLVLAVRSDGARRFMGTSARPDVVAAATFDDPACRAFLRALYERSSKAHATGILEFATPVAIRAREMLQVWTIISDLGWGAFVVPISLEAWRDVSRGKHDELRTFAAQHGWQWSPASVTMGEVLVAVDGETPWDELASLHAAFYRMGVHDLSFVVKDHAGELRKLRTPLPRD